MPAKSWSQLVADAGDTAKTFEPLPDGQYDLKIVAAELKPSSTGKTGYNITAEVEAGSPYANRKVFNTFYVSPESPAAMGIFFRQFAALGLDSNFFSSEPTDEQVVAALVGRRFLGTLATRIDNSGTKRNDLKNVAAPRGGAQAPATATLPGAVPGVPAPAPVAAPAAPVAAPAPAVEVAAPPVPVAAPAASSWGQLGTPSTVEAPATPAPPPLPPLSGPGGAAPAF